MGLGPLYEYSTLDQGHYTIGLTWVGLKLTNIRTLSMYAWNTTPYMDKRRSLLSGLSAVFKSDFY